MFATCSHNLHTLSGGRRFAPLRLSVRDVCAHTVPRHAVRPCSGKTFCLPGTPRSQSRQSCYRACLGVCTNVLHVLLRSFAREAAATAMLSHYDSLVLGAFAHRKTLLSDSGRSHVSSAVSTQCCTDELEHRPRNDSIAASRNADDRLWARPERCGPPAGAPLPAAVPGAANGNAEEPGSRQAPCARRGGPATPPQGSVARPFSQSCKPYCCLVASCIRELMAAHTLRYLNLVQHNAPYTPARPSAAPYPCAPPVTSLPLGPSSQSRLGLAAAALPPSQHTPLDFLSSIGAQYDSSTPIQGDDYFYNCSLPDALAHLHKYFRNISALPTVALIYLERLLSARPGLFVPRSVILILYGVVLLLAAKFLDDTQYSNEHCAAYLGLRLNVFNALERSVLRTISYRLYVHPDTYRPVSELLWGGGTQPLREETKKRGPYFGPHDLHRDGGSVKGLLSRGLGSCRPDERIPAATDTKPVHAPSLLQMPR